MFETIVHQTAKDNGINAFIEHNGPFRAIKKTFLGYGYYFWDDHYELAEWWGEVHYKGRYVICEGEFSISKDEFLDLVGSRQDQKYFMRLIEQFNLTGKPIGKVIEFLKDVDAKPGYNGVFPFKAIRAIDVYKGGYNDFEIKFEDEKAGLMLLKPKIIICMKEKNTLLLRTFKVIYRKTGKNKK